MSDAQVGHASDDKHDTVPFRIYTWNVKGLSGKQKQKDLQSTVQRKFGKECIILLQETHTDAGAEAELLKAFPQSTWTTYSSQAAGVGIIINSDGLLQLNKTVWRGQDGRRIDALVNTPIGEIRVSSIYAPTGTVEQSAFFRDNLPCEADEVDVFAGDWNNITRVTDSANFKSKGIKGFPLMQELFEETGHVDAWDLQPWAADPKAYTFTHVQKDDNGRTKRRRLDRIYISPWLTTRVQKVEVAHVEGLPLDSTDHRPVIATIASDIPQSKRIWRANNMDFQNDAVRIALKEMAMYVTSRTDLSLAAKLKMIKKEAKNIICTNRQLAAKSNLNSMYEELLNDELIDEDDEAVAEIREAWRQERRESDEEVLQRLNLSCDITREAPSKMMSNMLRSKKAATTITGIKTVDGGVASSPEDMKKEAEKYFTHLYRERPYDREALSLLVDAWNPPEQDAWAGFAEPFSENEVLAALTKANASKAPGLDGLGAGFYKLLCRRLEEH
jgi:exonuclease III